MKYNFLVLILIFLTACGERDLKTSADRYKETLIDSISNATKVEMVEHAWITDYEEKDQKIMNEWDEEYKKVALDAHELNELIQVIKNSKYNKDEGVILYPKVPYHNCIIIHNGKSASYLYVSSYWCEWLPSKSNELTPHTLPEDLLKFFQEKGFDTSDSAIHWRNKLYDHLESKNLDSK